MSDLPQSREKDKINPVVFLHLRRADFVVFLTTLFLVISPPSGLAGP